MTVSAVKVENQSRVTSSECKVYLIMIDQANILTERGNLWKKSQLSS